MMIENLKTTTKYIERLKSLIPSLCNTTVNIWEWGRGLTWRFYGCVQKNIKKTKVYIVCILIFM